MLENGGAVACIVVFFFLILLLCAGTGWSNYRTYNQCKRSFMQSSNSSSSTSTEPTNVHSTGHSTSPSSCNPKIGKSYMNIQAGTPCNQTNTPIPSVSGRCEVGGDFCVDGNNPNSCLAHCTNVPDPYGEGETTGIGGCEPQHKHCTAGGNSCAIQQSCLGKKGQVWYNACVPNVSSRTFGFNNCYYSIHGSIGPECDKCAIDVKSGGCKHISTEEEYNKRGCVVCHTCKHGLSL